MNFRLLSTFGIPLTAFFFAGGSGGASQQVRTDPSPAARRSAGRRARGRPHRGSPPVLVNSSRMPSCIAPPPPGLRVRNRVEHHHRIAGDEPARGASPRGGKTDPSSAGTSAPGRSTASRRSSPGPCRAIAPALGRRRFSNSAKTAFHGRSGSPRHLIEGAAVLERRVHPLTVERDHGMGRVAKQNNYRRSTTVGSGRSQEAPSDSGGEVLASTQHQGTASGNSLRRSPLRHRPMQRLRSCRPLKG